MTKVDTESSPICQLQRSIVTLEFGLQDITGKCSKGSDITDFSSRTLYCMNGCCKSSTAVGRWEGSRCRHFLMKSLHCSDRWSGIGGSSLLFPILNIAAICRWEKRGNIWWLLTYHDQPTMEALSSQCFIKLHASKCVFGVFTSRQS